MFITCYAKLVETHMKMLTLVIAVGGASAKYSLRGERYINIFKDLNKQKKLIISFPFLCKKKLACYKHFISHYPSGKPFNHSVPRSGSPSLSAAVSSYRCQQLSREHFNLLFNGHVQICFFFFCPIMHALYLLSQF